MPSEPFSKVPSQEDPETFGIEFIRGLPESEGTESGKRKFVQSWAPLPYSDD